MFLNRYRSFMVPGGIVHLKTDSRFLYEYTMAVVRANGLDILAFSTDIYNSISHCRPRPAILYEEVTGVQTFYEKMFLQMGLPITYMAFVIDHQGDYVYPEFDADYWRSVEGPRRSFSHQPSSRHSGLDPES